MLGGGALLAVAIRMSRCARDLLVGAVVAQQRLEPVDAVQDSLLADADLSAELGKGRPARGPPSAVAIRAAGPPTKAR